MRTVFFTLLAMAQANDVMYAEMKRIIPSFNRVDIDEMFRNCFKDSFCLEIFADHSRDSEVLIGMLHESVYTPGLIYEETDHVLCRDRLFISRSLGDTWNILASNKAPEVRFFLFLLDIDKSTLRHFFKRFQNESSVFQYSAGHIIDLTDTKTVYSYNIIQNRFIQYNTSNIKLYEKDVVEDFGGKVLTVATYNCSIHSLVGPLDEKGFPAYIGGAELRFFDLLSRKLNFTYSIVAPTGDDKVGQVFRNRSWANHGIIGLVGERKVDVGFCSILMTTHLRQAAIDATDSPTRICVKFLVPRRDIIAKRGGGLTKPFQWEAWVLVATGLILLPLLTTLFAFLIGSHLESKDNPIVKSYTSYATAFIRGWGIMLSNAPKSLEELGPLRYLIGSWAATGLLVGTFYACSLRSSLLSVNKGASYDTIQEMVESNLFWALNHKMDFDFIFNLEDYWHRKWIEKFKVLSFDHQCDLIKDKKQALLARIHTEGVLANIPCTKYLNKYKVSVECLRNINTAFILQDKSPYTKIFSTYINNLNENGIFKKEYGDAFHKLSLKEPYVLNSLKIREETANREVKLSLYNMGSSVMLVALGNGFALLIFILELVWFYRRKIYHKLKCS